MEKELLEFCGRCLLNAHCDSDHARERVRERIADRWKLEIVPGVVNSIRARYADTADAYVKLALSGMVSGALFAEGLALARSEGTRRAADIEDEAFRDLESLARLLGEHGTLAYDGAAVNNPPDVGALIEDVARIEPAWRAVCGIDRVTEALATTSQPSPTFLHLIESCLRLWRHDRTKFQARRGDVRTGVAHEVLDIVDRLELTHAERAVILNVAEGGTQHSPESVKQLMARRKKGGNVIGQS